MKNNYKSFSVLVLTAFYCFAISIAAKSSTHYVFHSNVSNSHEHYFSNVSTKLFNHTLETESSIPNFNSLSFSFFKNYFNGFYSVLKSSNQLEETSISN